MESSDDIKSTELEGNLTIVTNNFINGFEDLKISTG